MKDRRAVRDDRYPTPTVDTVTAMTVPGWRPQAAKLAEHELTSRGVVVLGTALLCAATALQVWLTSSLGVFFSICFVLTVLTTTLLVRSDGFFVVGVLPPLLMLALLTAVAYWAPTHIDAPVPASAGIVQLVIAGLVAHATPLVVAHLAALGIIAARVHAAPPVD
jgi:hypothetical protein